MSARDIPVSAVPRADVRSFAEALAQALTSREGTRTPIELTPTAVGTFAAAFNLDCAAGSYTIIVAGRS